MPITQDGKKPFIAVNILPAPPATQPGMREPLHILKEQIAIAKELGFTHAWINPISVVPSDTVCTRRCLDTGVYFNLTGSLYAPDDPKEIRPDFDMVRIREMVGAEKSNNFFVLIDFVWKHVSVKSKMLERHPNWFGEKKDRSVVKDIVEYKFQVIDGKFTSDSQEVIDHLIATIDVLLDPVAGYGFAGLRVDAASKLTPLVRRTLYEHIKTRWPEAIIFEEVLFDKANSSSVEELVKDAQIEPVVHSHYVTSNLYYQKPDCFGALPSPEQMGDTLKLQLANQRGVSFTGNHDHHSLGWGIILTMAAKLLIKQDQLHLADLTVAPFEKYPSIKNGAEKAKQTITDLSEGRLLIEGLTSEQQSVIQYLLPFANIIARILLNKAHGEHDQYFSDFRFQLFEKMSNRTLASISGYFFLFSELISPFETQRIFSNRSGSSLDFLLLTEEDLKSEMDLTHEILVAMSRTGDYPNFANFTRRIPLLMKNKKIITQDKAEKLSYELRISLPYIIEYLRNHPGKHRAYQYYQINPEEGQNQYELELMDLTTKLDFASFIQQINLIYSQLASVNSNEYHTFTSLDHFKIFVRCSKDTTDVIILNMDHQNVQTLSILDLEKIALWFQARIYPYCPHGGQSVKLAEPFTEEQTQYFPADYSGYWVEKVGRDAFNFSYERILGKKNAHQTNLYLGLNITNGLSPEERKSFKRVVHLFTPVQAAYNILEQRSLKCPTHGDEQSGAVCGRWTKLAASSLPSSPRGKALTFFSKSPDKKVIEESPLTPHNDL